MELLEASMIETVRFPEVVDLVFPISILGETGVVYTLTAPNDAMAFPVGLVRRI